MRRFDGFKVTVFDRGLPGVFFGMKGLRLYLTGSRRGCLTFVDLGYKRVYPDFVGAIDADAEVKQRDYNPLATLLSGVPVYGNMVVFRHDEEKGFRFCNLLPGDADYLKFVVDDLMKGEQENEK